jgi:hypothetical protein
MKLQLRVAGISLLILAISLACVGLTAGDTPTSATSADELVFVPVLFTPTPSEVSCPLITDEAIRLALVENDAGRNLPAKENVALVRYTFSGDTLVSPTYNPTVESSELKKLQMSRNEHTRIWDYFRAIIPAEQRSFLTEFIIITDGNRNLLAAVSQTEDAPDKWALLVDIADTKNAHELTYTMIHEFGHLLTLGPAQVVPSLAIFKDPKDSSTYFQELAACFTYFPGEGCSNPGSYIDEFYNRFWLDIYDEWNKIEFERDEAEYIENMEAFYLKYEDRFVTDYSVTRPVEDIAESFTFFILSPMPDGDTIAEQKILFFYDFPELVELRKEILKNVCENFPQ